VVNDSTRGRRSMARRCHVSARPIAARLEITPIAGLSNFAMRDSTPRLDAPPLHDQREIS